MKRKVLGQMQVRVLEVAKESGVRGVDKYDVAKKLKVKNSHPSIPYALESLAKKGLLVDCDGRYVFNDVPPEDVYAAGDRTMSVRLAGSILVFYSDPFKKTGRPVIVKNAQSGRFITTDRVVLFHDADGRRQEIARLEYDNAPAGIKAQGPTTLLEIKMEGD
jgi:hypothetical protein